MKFLCTAVLLVHIGLSQQLSTASELVRAMHERYTKSWYKTLTFTQKTVTHQADGSTKEETWFEAMKIPGSLRIDFAPRDSGNGVLFTRDSLFVFRKGVLRSSRPLIHSLLVLGFDVYAQPVEETLKKLTALKYDLTQFQEGVWQGRAVYIVGAKKGDRKSRQFWVNKERLLFVRSLEPNPSDSNVTTEIRFNKYEKFDGGWVAPEVLFFQNGKMITEEYYSDIKTDISVPDRLFDPTQWTVDAGDVFVANISSSTITYFDGATGKYKGIFVEKGSGGLKAPTGITFGPDGHLYVASSMTHQVLRYDGKTGIFKDVFTQLDTLDRPFSIIFGPDRHLYVSSGTGHKVLRFDGASGTFLNVAASGQGLKQPIGLVFGPDKLLYVVNSVGKNILRFDPSSGEPRGVFAADSLRYPSDCAFGPDGSLYVSDAAKSRIVVFDAKFGAFVKVFGTLPDKGVPMGLAFTSDGSLFVGDFGKSRLTRIAKDGGTARILSIEGLAEPENITTRR